jgi:thiol:disulfide interchange protein
MRKVIPLFIALLLNAPIHGQQVVAPPPAEIVPLVDRATVRAGGELRAALQVTLPEGFHANANKPRDPILIPMTASVDAPAGITVNEVVFPEAKDFPSLSSSQPLRVFEGTFPVGFVMTVGKEVPPGAIKIPIRLRYQACNETMCFLPKTIASEWLVQVVASGAAGPLQHQDVFKKVAFGTGDKPGAAPAAAAAPPPAAAPTDSAASLDDFEVLASTGGSLGTDDFVRFIHNAENGIKEQGLLEGRGPIAMVLLVLLGGLALNLTPCVLPMIPINLAIIGAGARAGSRGKGFLLGATYGAAMAAVYGVIGLIVILTAGTFGTINSNPWFNLGIAVLFGVLALAMFDVVNIDFSRFSTRFGGSGQRRGTFALAFGMGAIAALLAGACVAPVVIQVVVLASDLYAAGTTLALGLPFVLGVGMAIPWPVAGAGIAALPKPGAWMVRVKQLFGIAILGTALYYGYHAYTIFQSRSIDPAAVAASAEEQLKAGWHASLQQGLAIAKRDRKPVLVDLWATWCTNCLIMDKTTLRAPAVTDALSNYVKIKFQAEDLDAPVVRDVMKRFNAVGLPTYVILRPR